MGRELGQKRDGARTCATLWQFGTALGLLLGFAHTTFAQASPGPAEVTHVPYSFHHLRIVGGGFITGILFHPRIKTLAYCRTDIGGAYRWDEASGRWIALSEWVPAGDANLIGVESMAVDPAHPDDLYLAAGTYTHADSPNGALLRSHDRGKSFERIPLPFKLGANEEGRFAGERLALDPVHPGTLYLGTRVDGLWRSLDNGTTWGPVSSFPGRTGNGVGLPFVLPGPKKDGSAGAMYAGVSSAEDNLFVSEDAGASWGVVNGAPRGLLPNHAAFDTSGVMYLTYGNKPGPNGMTAGAVWRRSKEGTWKDVTPELAGAGGGYGGLALGGDREGTVVVSTMDRWRPGDTLFRTTDGGRHWASLRDKAKLDPAGSEWLRGENGAVPMGHWIGAVAIDPFDSDHMLYGAGETLWATHDAGRANHGRSTHWTVGAEGIEETAAISLTSPPSGPQLFVGLGDIGCFRADDVSARATATVLRPPRLSNCDSVAVAAQSTDHVVMTGRVWSGTSHGGYSDDGGKSWKIFATEPEQADKGGRIAISTDGAAVVWTTPAGAFGSKDSGDKWQQLAEGHDLEVVADRTAADSFYVMDRSRGVLFEATLGSGLRELQNGLAHELTMLPGAYAGVLWMFGIDGVIRMQDGKLSKLRSVHSASALALGMAMTPGGPETLYFAGDLGGTKGIYRSADDGQTWVRLDDKDHEYGVVTPLSGDPRVPGRVYLGTNGFGVVVAEPE